MVDHQFMIKVIAFSVLFTLTVFSQNFPKQEGFTWWKTPALKGAILVPDSWHQKSVVKENALAYFVTKTEITEKNKEFEIGLTLNVFKEFEKNHGENPLAWATKYKKLAIEKGKLLDSWTKKKGPFKSMGFQTEIIRDEKTIITHHLFIFNPKTGTLYFYLFEAPKTQWQEAWKHGDKMLKLLMIDDEV